MPMDLMEWRADWFEEVEHTERVLDVLSKIHEILQIRLFFSLSAPKKKAVSIQWALTPTYL